jgi:hypothetical protein
MDINYLLNETTGERLRKGDSVAKDEEAISPGRSLEESSTPGSSTPTQDDLDVGCSSLTKFTLIHGRSLLTLEKDVAKASVSAEAEGAAPNVTRAVALPHSLPGKPSTPNSPSLGSWENQYIIETHSVSAKLQSGILATSTSEKIVSRTSPMSCDENESPPPVMRNLTPMRDIQPLTVIDEQVQAKSTKLVSETDRVYSDRNSDRRSFHRPYQ